MNFSPDKFVYHFQPVEGRAGIEIVLTRLETGEQKIFYQANARPETCASLASHMDSLTDDLMLQWFQQRERKPKKSK